MLVKLKNAVIERKVASLLKRYQVELLHHTPGRVRVRVKNWKENQELLFRLIGEMEQDPAIGSVSLTKETGSIVIHYDRDAVKDPAAYERFKKIFTRYFG